MDYNSSPLRLPLLKNNGIHAPRVKASKPPPEFGSTRPGVVCPRMEEQHARLLPSDAGESESSVPPAKPGVDYINLGHEDQSELYGYRRSTSKTALTWFAIVLTGGFLRLVFHWAPRLMLKATHRRCSLSDATRILVVEQYKKYKKYFVKDIKFLSADTLCYDDDYVTILGGISADSECKKKMKKDNAKKSNEDTSYLVVPDSTGQMKRVKHIRWFNCKKIIYIWDRDTESFYRLYGLDNGQSLSDLHSYRGFSWVEQLRRRFVYGENNIKVPVQPIWKLLFLEALNPFYIFQVFSVCLWYADNYVYYATVIVFTSVISIISEVYQMHRNQMSLSSTIQSCDVVEVLRDGGETASIPSEQMVPGDVIIIPPQGCMMQCDAVLLQGNAIVNESMLTGESVPVTKTPLLNRRDEVFTEKEHSRHILFCGTQVIQTRFYGNEKVRAVVIRTGFMTSKGSLVRSIMFPPPVDFKFQQDTYKFILVLVAIASIGFLYTVINKYKQGLSASNIALDSLDLITIVVPPALPMAMTVGILYALRRLKRLKIFCISPRSINISGVLDCVCFDKTGTLTEDGLDMKGVVGVTTNREKLILKEIIVATELPQDHLLYSMAACHSITVINMKMVGDPLDLKMFESTEWVLEEPGTDDTCKYDMIMPSIVKPNKESLPVHDEPPLEIGILRQFPFSSSLQRMSVITRKLGDSTFSLYCKGSPEMIMTLSKLETIPSDLTEVLYGYTQKGFRVLAVGWKPLKLSYTKAHRISREEVEKELTFLGLLVFENRLKVETTPVIHQLRNANIRTVMITGDNMLTALSVGRECGLVGSQQSVITVKAFKNIDRLMPYKLQFQSATPKEHQLNGKDHNLNIDDPKYCFATEGKSWAVIYNNCPDLLKKLVVRGAIFARMSPEQKQQLIMQLQSLGYYVGMCGDGANDCGALKSAHVGISLSEAEASVASPFTSQEANISCVSSLIREGRTALVTSFGVFKYMASYSLTQFVSVMILYSINSNLTDIQFLYIDLFLITLFAVFFGRTVSYKGPLTATPPASSLISLEPIMSLLLHLALVVAFQTFAFFYVQVQPWYVPFNSTQLAENPGCYENYAVYSISQFQYIILAVVFSMGPPYRQPIYTNFLLTGSIIVMTIISVYLTVYPAEELAEVFQIFLPPAEEAGVFFRWQIVIFSIVNSALAIFVEYFVVDFLIHQKLKSKLSSNEKSKKKYFAVENWMKKDPSWPPPEAECGDKLTPNGRELSLNPRNLFSTGTPETKEQNGKEFLRVPSVQPIGSGGLTALVGIPTTKTTRVNGDLVPEDHKGPK